MNPFKFGVVVKDEYFLAKKENPLTDRSIPASTAYSAIKRLVKQGYVIRTNTYELEDPFFGEWILQDNT